jgi:hypothetical protein
MSVDAIVKQVEELGLEQRAEVLRRVEQGLIAAGWDPDLALSDEMRALLAEREADADANPGVGYTLEEAMEYIRRKR